MLQGGLFNNQNHEVTLNLNKNQIYKTYSYQELKEGAIYFDKIMELNISKHIIKDSFNKISDMRVMTKRLLRQHTITNNSKERKKRVDVAFEEYKKQSEVLADFFEKYKNILAQDKDLHENFVNVFTALDAVTAVINQALSTNGSGTGKYTIDFDNLLLKCDYLEKYLIESSLEGRQ